MYEVEQWIIDWTEGAVAVDNDVNLRDDILRFVISSLGVSAGSLKSQSFDTVGDGTGVTEMATTAAEYKIVPPADELYNVAQITVMVEDNVKFRGDRYGATTALANGVVASVKDSGDQVVSSLTTEPVKKMSSWMLEANGNVHFTDFPQGNDVVSVALSFPNGLRIDGTMGHYLSLEVQDNLGVGGAALVSHKAAAHFLVLRVI